MTELIQRLYVSVRACFRKWNVVIISAAVALVVVLVAILSLSGQENVGSSEAGKQLSQLAQNIRNFYQTRPDYWGLSTQEVIRQKIYPSSMKVVDGYLVGYFNNEVQIGADQNGMAVMPTVKEFVIAYHGLNRSQCMALATAKFSQDFWLGVSSMTITNDVQTREFGWSNRDSGLPANKDSVNEICSRNESNSIIFGFEL